MNENYVLDAVESIFVIFISDDIILSVNKFIKSLNVYSYFVLMGVIYHTTNRTKWRSELFKGHAHPLRL